ncbi:MAG: DUF4147 domain-containing protein [Planctomycetaceae bacterium]|jgi:hydroxypyruvate reductase|nr:DUF4147 domain-containing protein [Planctomycetaceae bacterium]
MARNQNQLREDMLAIWRAGVAGVSPERLIRENISLEPETLWIAEKEYPLRRLEHITVIGGGKASGAMAATLEEVLAPLVDRGRISGWVNVPEDCVRTLRAVHLHGARPAGVNEPTEAGVWGTSQMLRQIRTRKKPEHHLVLVLISGGGSALMPYPAEGVTLEQKLAVTRFLAESGAAIEEINTVRKQLSAFKGGGLRRMCRGRNLVSLILSDVTGDPLDVIASGPTTENLTTASDAVTVLQKYRMTESPEYAGTGKAILADLQRKASQKPDRNPSVRFMKPAASEKNVTVRDSEGGSVRNLVIGNNAAAVDAAGLEAERRGYSHAMISAAEPEGLAEEVGRKLLGMARLMQQTPGADCLLSGGEPVVRLAAAEKRGLGGRNQQLVLAALQEVLRSVSPGESNVPACRLGFLSGGTDGEDGPTDAAGAFFDDAVLEKVRSLKLDPSDSLTRNDAYRFFEQVGGLLKTGPTGTNVCDLRVIVLE